jgi:hypothetical protein
MGPGWPHVQGCYLPRGGIGGLASGAPAVWRPGAAGGPPPVIPLIPGLGSGGADQPQRNKRHRQVPVAQCGGAWG